MKRIVNVVLVLSCLLALSCPVLAAEQATEVETAAAYLRQQGIMVGDETGNMNLNNGLTRAQLATILTKITVNQDYLAAEQEYYTSRCEFTDVPSWAQVYVGYCVSRGFVNGYGNGLYGANDPVTPAAACTVMLRCLEDGEQDWTYDTACQKAVSLGLVPTNQLSGAEMTRGGMAILIYRTMAAMGYDVGIKETSSAQPNTDGSVVLLTESSQYIPKVGDVIWCSDGTDYTITDVSHWDNNVFASGSVGELPTATCDWSLFAKVELPKVEARHFSTSTGEALFVRNLYETRRMQYTIYNALGSEPSAWNGSTPLATVELSIPADLDAYTSAFWPWRASELENLVHSRPNSHYYVDAWDYYLNGVFQYTRYCVVSL
jgi:hypothetical protein